MQQRFCQFITENELFSISEKILLTVSGGIDSVVMAELFYKSGFQFGIAHCNFGLRGEESDADEQFVRNLAHTLSVPCYVKRFNTQEYSTEKGVSIQMAAKELRYSWFYELIQKEGYSYFATAHHRNDVLESVLLNLTKGTGIQGLTGIRLKTEKVIRPLLSFSREEIENYAKENNLNWREDSSNASSKYQRNKIRLHVIPELKKINPSLEETFEQSLEKISAVENLIQFQVNSLRAKAVRESYGILIIDSKVLSNFPEPEYLLFELVKGSGFTFHDVKNIYHSSQAGKWIRSGNLKLIKDRDQFLITPVQQSSQNYSIGRNLEKLKTSTSQYSFSIVENQNFVISKDPAIACVDFDKIQFPLELRNWERGDWFLPIGLGKRKKISDFLIDLKIPSGIKEQVKLLISEGSVVWVVGMRLDERFKITPETQKILMVKIE